MLKKLYMPAVSQQSHRRLMLHSIACTHRSRGNKPLCIGFPGPSNAAARPPHHDARSPSQVRQPPSLQPSGSSATYPRSGARTDPGRLRHTASSRWSRNSSAPPPSDGSVVRPQNCAVPTFRGTGCSDRAARSCGRRGRGRLALRPSARIKRSARSRPIR